MMNYKIVCEMWDIAKTDTYRITHPLPSFLSPSPVWLTLLVACGSRTFLFLWWKKEEMRWGEEREGRQKRGERGEERGGGGGERWGVIEIINPTLPPVQVPGGYKGKRSPWSEFQCGSSGVWVLILTWIDEWREGMDYWWRVVVVGTKSQAQPRPSKAQLRVLVH